MFPLTSPSWGTATISFVLLGFRLFRCAGLLLLRDRWELGRALLIAFAFVELFGFLVEFVQVEFPDYVFLEVLDRRREGEQVRQRQKKTPDVC